MSPTPDWYSAIKTTITDSQSDANNWLNNSGPGVVSGMCTAFLDYSGTFTQVVATELAPILAEAAKQNGIPTPAQQRQLVQIFTAIQQSATRHATTTKNLLAAMSSYKKDLDTSLGALNLAIASALPAEAKDKQSVQQIQSKINDIELTLAADNSSATDNSLNIQSAVSSLVVGLTFGMAFHPVGFGIALLGVGTSIVVSIESQQQVQADLKEIAKRSQSLATAETQLGLLQGIVANLESLSKGIQSALAVYSDFDDSWQSAQIEIASFRKHAAKPGYRFLIAEFEDAKHGVVRMCGTGRRRLGWCPKTMYVTDLEPYTYSIADADLEGHAGAEAHWLADEVVP